MGKLVVLGRLKRNKALVVALLPVFVVIFMFGWLLYWAGEPKGKTISTEHASYIQMQTWSGEKVEVPA